MIKIQVNEDTINVPQTWGDVTLGDYERYYSDKPVTARERVVYVAKICNADPDLLMSWPADVYTMIVNTIDFLFKNNPVAPTPEVMIGGVKYTVSVEDDITLGAWVDAEEAQKAGDKVLSSVLSIMCRPTGEAYDYKLAEQRQTLFAAQPVANVLGVMAFFLQCSDALEKRIAAYSTLGQLADKLPQLIPVFRPHGGGIKLSRIWPAIKYLCLIKLLHWRLRKHLRLFSITATGRPQKKRKGN